MPKASRVAKVSIHARAKRATKSFGHRRSPDPSFNPRPREAGDLFCDVLADGLLSFNPRPREAGDARAGMTSSSCPCFNPRPREAGDLKAFQEVINEALVSIHARAKRATADGRAGPFQGPVSIHARAKRATGTKEKFSDEAKFQSTPARSGRHGGNAQAGHLGAVSIHARAKRATRSPSHKAPISRVSIHARAKRATVVLQLPGWEASFQSTPARSGRLICVS